MIKAVVDRHNSTTYIISIPTMVSESVFLQRAAGRPDSYAWRLVTRDGLSRLTQEVNPESGTTSYAYDASGQQGDISTRTTPKAVATYSFDQLHRPTGISYSDGTPQTILQYDQSSLYTLNPQNPKGKLTNALVSGVADTVFSYDPMGRVVDDWQCTPVNCGTGSFRMNYSYNYLGDIISNKNYFENITYTFTYNAADYLTKMQSSVSDSNHPGTLLTVNSYNAPGGLTGATLGNNVARAITYDKRMRTTALTDGSIYNYSLGYAPDNYVVTGTDSLTGNWAYAYDDFGRLSTSNKNNGQQTFTYLYDRYGNRWQQNAPQGGPAPQYTFTNANNQITASGISYNASGDITNDSFHSYSYDGEGRVTSVDSTLAVYTYDALGHRVRKSLNGGANVTDYIYDLNGRVVDAVSGTTWVRGELYAGGLHVATYNGTSSTYFDHRDWLGTVRARSGPGGTTAETCTNYAFGDGQTCTSPDYSPEHFTGQEWDSESNLTHFLFRQYSTTEGRWITPDPAGLAATDARNPQTWNRYVYVLNNPLTLIDPTGLDCVYLNDQGDRVEAVDPGGCDFLSGGYFIPGTVFIGNVVVDSESGLIGAWSPMGSSFNIAGAEDSNPYGAWTQTFDTSGLLNNSGSVAANNGNWVRTNVTAKITAGPAGAQKTFCDTQSDMAALEELIPGGHVFLGGDYKPATIDAAAREEAVEKALELGGESTSILYTIRSWTGIPMSASAKIASGIGYALLAKSIYDATTAMQTEFRACMEN